ncbi:MAG: tetratricopeptide repeat protein [Actinomycetota bacterium]
MPAQSSKICLFVHRCRLIIVVCFLILLPARLPLARAQNSDSDESYSQTILKTYDLPFGKQPFLPSHAETASGSFIPSSAYPSAEYCAHCHADIHAQWRQSAHANSFREPFYLRNVEILIKEKGIEASRHCEGCHNPIALFSGALTSGSKLQRPFDSEGVTCMVCHSIQKIQNTSGTGSYVLGVPAVMVREDGTPIPGEAPFNDILARPDLHSRAVMRDFYRTPEYCASCHKAAIPKSLNGYRWLRAFTVYDEWQRSSWSKQSLAPFYTKAAAVTCQSCHMPAESAPHDYAAQEGHVRSHRWVAANTAIPTYYGYAEQLRRTKDFLKKAVNIDIFGMNKNNGALIAPIEEQSFSLNAGDSVTVDIVIQNDGIGHSLVPEQRDIYESWLAFTVTDASGKEIYRSGFLDKNGVRDPEAHSYTNRLLTSSGKVVGLHQVWDTHIRSYDNTILPGSSDLARYRFRIPAGIRGPLTLTATLKYRRFRQKYTDYILQHTSNYPVVEMASRSLVVRIGENVPKAHTGNAPDYLRWNNYGIALLGEVQYEKAAAAFKKVISLNPKYVDAYTNVAFAMYTELLDHWREGADGLGAQGLKLGGTPDGTGNLFLAKARAPAFEPALAELKQALTIDPANLRARYHLGAIYRLQGRFGEAIAALEPVVAAYPRFRQARQELGYSYYVQHQFAQAREQFEALQKINPDDLTANYYLSYIYDQLGMKARAAEQIRIFEHRKEDVAAEPIAQEFWNKNSDVAHELAPYHVHDLGGTSPSVASRAIK